ncbi:MAG: adenine phosphoribosyltransferase [Actinomycetota bacterium]
MGDLSVDAIASLIRDVPDFPEPGITFKDITPLLADPEGLDSTMRLLAEPWRDREVDVVVGIEARGFILGTSVARELGVGFVPIRKAGKLPSTTVAETYGLEYGTDTIEMHADAVGPAARVLVLDDVLATGGTAAAAGALLERVGAEVVGYSFLMELAFLNGRAKLGGATIESMIEVA